MKTLHITLPVIAVLSLAMVAFAQGPAGGPGRGNGPGGGGGTPSLDPAEEVHLLFMRAEEKLAHDVYSLFADRFFDYAVFSNIRDSEAKHVATMIAKIEQFGLTDPNAGDAPGEFSDANFGYYFDAEYLALTDIDTAASPLLEALLSGVEIETLDMHDIVLCPDEIVDTVDYIIDETYCGMDYTDEKALISSYGNLLEGSGNHLLAFCRVIETVFPEEYPDQCPPVTE